MGLGKGLIKLLRTLLPTKIGDKLDKKMPILKLARMNLLKDKIK